MSRQTHSLMRIKRAAGVKSDDDQRRFRCPEWPDTHEETSTTTAIRSTVAATDFSAGSNAAVERAASLRLLRAIAKQAETERERRAKIIHAEGELQASDKLLEAAQKLAQAPQAMQLRYLQTLTAIAGEKTSTIIFPMPIDLIASVLDRLSDRPKPG